MMNEDVINLAEAKKHFSELIGKIAHGKKEILITKRGRPMARIIPADQPVRHLADAKGWLDENDPFFNEIDHIIQNRKKHIPRLIKENET
jgi:prevent-host-death family protein